MRACRGLSLTELLCVLAIAGLLCVLASPAFTPLLARHRLALRTDALSSAIALGKNLAITRGESYALVPLKEGVDWSGGFALIRGTVFEEQEVIQRQAFNASEADIHWQGMQSPKMLVFAAHFGHSLCNGRFVLKATSASRTLVINRLCRVRLEKTDYTERKGT